ncbi:MAG: saccharopine dehydrogenase NADP-binding domain-containing protein [Rhodospirillaceae bacterium]|nr:saccharopine dehydrogenase NADP-binding domain-containing protein [Rhodospirillaceae bacterium]
MARTKVFLVGAGKIGRAIAAFLTHSGDYAVTVGDSNAAALPALGGHCAGTVHLDVHDRRALELALAGHDIVVNAAPFTLTVAIAGAAHAVGAHYFDLTEDVASTRFVKELAETAATAFVPQCGLAPGFVSIVAGDLAKRFDRLDELKLRVGALPRYPSNALKYNLTWSVDGLINEYCNPCEAVVDGERRTADALEGRETLVIDGVEYEAFNTSGGLGTLADTLEGRVRTLNYRTIRYPGHVEILRLLLNDLKLRDRRDLLKQVLEAAVPATLQDVVVVFVTAAGHRGGALVQDSFATRVLGREIQGQAWGAIQITTAAGVCAMVDLLRSGVLPRRGLVRQEQVDLATFLDNRFGQLFRPEPAVSGGNARAAA